jgi:hypothetical protein
VVEQVGSLAGFAAVVGLAILSALYFSQARDLRRLREWAGRAPERAAEGQQGTAVPGRVVAVPQQPRPQQPAPGAAPQPATPQPATPAGAAPANGEKAPEGDKQEQSAAAATNGDSAPSVTAPGAEKTSQGEGDEPGDGGAPAAKPGMPAPASAAAAAAGAGTKSVAGPAAPGSAVASSPAAPEAKPTSSDEKPDEDGAAKPEASAAGTAAPAAGAAAAGAAASGPAPTTGPRPAASPQRPPGSVLPPRTGTLPPVRRLPSSNVGPGQTGVLGQAPEPQKKKRNPVYVVLAIAGVLVLGAAAAVGVPALVNGSKDDNSAPSKSSKTKSSTNASKKSAPAVAPDKITVAVLNGTSIPGLAAQVGDRVDAEGFTLGTVSNASQTQGQRANSVAMYAPGHASDARRVARRLGIGNVTRVDSETQGIAGDASVVVIVGSDKTQ